MSHLTTVRYAAEVFDPATVADAREIVLMPEPGMSSEARWQRETPYLLSLLGDVEGPVLDYGCGIGRLSKALLDRDPTLQVIGLDPSLRMRKYAADYVKRPGNFQVLGPEARPTGFRTVLAVWVLQHVENPALELSRISHALVPGGKLFVVNERRRAIPISDQTVYHWTDVEWADDGIDIHAELRKRFTEQRVGRLQTTIVGMVAASRTFYGHYRKAS